jgi:hypothetical protein
MIGPRANDDVILTNVIGFDVKVYDPEVPTTADPEVSRYVDLGYANESCNPGDAANAPLSLFSHRGHPGSDLEAPATSTASAPAARVYCTWSFHYEHDGIDQDADSVVDEGADGFDNDGGGVVDDGYDPSTRYRGEWETVAPYPVPLRGVQVTIRIFEPDSRQIREVTVVQQFLPK